MQGSGRILVSSARQTISRLSQTSGTAGIKPFYSSRPPPSLLLSSTSLQQRRGYRRTVANLKDDDEKRHKPGKDVDKRDQPEDAATKSEIEDSKSADKTASSTKESKSGEAESTGTKEKRTKNQKPPEESIRPAVISRNQALSLVANNGSKSRLILTNHDHPEIYPQCMALAMSGRPILPGFYSIFPIVVH